MKILIDISHPAHVHLFRNFALKMMRKGCEFMFTCREKEFETDLLSYYNLPFISLGKKPDSLVGKFTSLIVLERKLYLVAKKFKPDLLLSHGSHTAAHIAFLLAKPHIAFEDTFNFEQIWLYKPFAKVILTSDYEHPLKSGKLIKYSGYHELAYLHPKYFIPDKSVLDDLGVRENEKYVIIRFVAWKASHDVGHKGVNLKNKILAVEEFSKYAKVFISSESPLPSDIAKYKITFSPHQMHNAIAFSSFVFGESATMVSEAAVLGIPGIYLDKKGRFYTNELQEKYNLVFNYNESEISQKQAIQKGVELLNMPDLKNEWQKRRQKMLADKIDVTAFLIWFVENYPQSFKIMKENPQYQQRFK